LIGLWEGWGWLAPVQFQTNKYPAMTDAFFVVLVSALPKIRSRAASILAASVGDSIGSHESRPDAISQPPVSHLLFRWSP